MNYLEMNEDEIHQIVFQDGISERMFYDLHEQALEELNRTEAAYNAVIGYMLGKGYMKSPMEFLSCWNEGNFEALREEWPDAPEEIYLADILYKGETK